MNLCAVSLSIAPEAESRRKKVKPEYHCSTGGYSVRRCAFYRPMIGYGGMECREECHWFNDGCTCRKARQAAKARAVKLMSSWTKSAVRRKN
jgi:hypothetical protein